MLFFMASSFVGFKRLSNNFSLLLYKKLLPVSLLILTASILLSHVCNKHFMVTNILNRCQKAVFRRFATPSLSIILACLNKADIELTLNITGVQLYHSFVYILPNNLEGFEKLIQIFYQN